MYLVVELQNKRKLLFESQMEVDAHLELNKLHDLVQTIREIDKSEYNAIMRETVENIRYKRAQAN